ncbi:hypothetical protein [Caballeronia sp. M23-90]
MDVPYVLFDAFNEKEVSPEQFKAAKWVFELGRDGDMVSFLAQACHLRPTYESFKDNFWFVKHQDSPEGIAAATQAAENFIHAACVNTDIVCAAIRMYAERMIFVIKMDDIPSIDDRAEQSMAMHKRQTEEFAAIVAAAFAD